MRGLTAYQFQDHIKLLTVTDTEIPLVRFYMNIEPFSVWIKSEKTTWYDFGKSILAILGGTYVVMRLLSRGTLGVADAAKAQVGGSRSRGGGRSGLSYGVMD